MPSAVPPRARTAEVIGPADPQASLPMSLTLQVQHRDELERLIAAQQEPGSSQYHHWLSPAEFTARFAPSADAYARLVGWLEGEGFTVRVAPNRLRIDFAGTVARVEQTFSVGMRRYRHRGRRHTANADAPLLPARFADTVAFVRLNTFPLAEPLLRVLLPSGLQDGMAPRDMRTAYNIGPLLDRGVDGSGQTIAVVARADFATSDVTLFQRQAHLATSEPAKVFPASNPGVGAPNGVCKDIPNRFERQACIQGEQGEVLLDVEWAGALAPGATVLVDISDTDIDASLLDVVNHHPEAKVISISFGSCERLDADSLRLFDPLYAQAAAQGQTVVVASGDGGADECRDGHNPSVNLLASHPNVTAVGGTALDPGFDSAGNATGYVSETVWNDRQGSSGGGVSTLVPRPAYQDVPGAEAGPFRLQPDVALIASPQSPGYVVVFGGEGNVVGGTSAAAPSWAGIVALLNHASHAHGLGALNDRLYALGRQQYGAGGPAVFHDVTAGDNNFNGVPGFGAGPGFDLATGLGTPDVDQLARAFEPPQCVGDCNSDGTVTLDEIITGVNVALGTFPVAQCAALDANGDDRISVDELIAAINRALNGC